MRLILPILTLFSLCTVAAALAAPVERPNVLIFLADDLGYSDIGVHGCKDIPTPHIDSLARSGIRFTNGYHQKKNTFYEELQKSNIR